ncbi:Nicotinate-nucleotide--dimethylbenzimidazole phosphoribosyltransferase [bacterium HR40]|nr:Nicotinate-nucleotide--dimethylbenzimidazole phosphoribosyltransferase [bacterium HR40]
MPDHPFSSLGAVEELLASLPEPDASMAAQARWHQAQLTKPPGSLGRLEELAEWLAAVQARHPPRLERVGIFVFAGNHGVVERGVSAYPAEVTAQMVANFERGGAAINQLAHTFGAELRVIPVEGLRPTADFTVAPAMSEAELLRALETGYEALSPGFDLVAVGEMGIGNTTAAAALAAALMGGPAERFVGPGTGLDAEGVRRKAEVVARALALHGETRSRPLELLRRVGGFELAAMAGFLLAAANRRVPVLLDGYVATAAAAVLHAVRPTALRHVRAAHRSAEPAHRLLLEHLALAPLLDLGMRLGEASGAAVAIGLVRAAIACHNGMATFESAGVSRSRGEEESDGEQGGGGKWA